jgi:hypothetical protein
MLQHTTSKERKVFTPAKQFINIIKCFIVPTEAGNETSNTLRPKCRRQNPLQRSNADHSAPSDRYGERLFVNYTPPHIIW